MNTVYRILNKLTDLGLHSEKSKIIESLFQKSFRLRDMYTNKLCLVSQIYDICKEGVKVMEEKWDYLIVLDACRYDYFEKYNIFEGKLEKKISRGSNTPEWIKNNFTTYYPNTIGISANPFFSEIKLNAILGYIPFNYLECVWDYGWSSDLSTVPPNKVTYAAMETVKKFPEKRAIIFYLQPHYPYIGEKRICFHEKRRKGEISKFWPSLKAGEIEITEVKRAYAENLKFVLNDIKTLLPYLDGKVIITADHGECFGELFLYAHPGVRIRELVEVPFFHVYHEADENEKHSKKIRDLKTLGKI